MQILMIFVRNILEIKTFFINLFSLKLCTNLVQMNVEIGHFNPYIVTFGLRMKIDNFDIMVSIISLSKILKFKKKLIFKV